MLMKFVGVMASGLILFLVGCRGSEPPKAPNVRDGQDKSKSGFMANSPEQNAREVTDVLLSTPEGRATANRLGNKDLQLTEFQNTNGITERIAEAAIKEWVTRHGGEFEWNLEEVKAICLRNRRNGIPYDYLPESEKRK